MASSYRTRRRIEFVDTDMAGIVHFSNFFRFMEAAEVDFLQSLGLSVSMQSPEGEWVGFPRVSASCDFIRPARFLDIIDIAVEVESIGAKSVTYRFEFTREGEKLAVGTITAVCCRTVGSQLESFVIPDSIRTKLQLGKPPPERGASAP